MYGKCSRDKDVSLHAIVMRKKPGCVRRAKNKTFVNLLKQDSGVEGQKQGVVKQICICMVYHIRPHTYNGGQLPLEARTAE